VRLDKQAWAEEKAAKGEAALQQGAIQDAFAHFHQLRSACPRIVSPILDTSVLSVPGKAFAFTLLSRMKAKLLGSRHVEHWFTHGNFTDCKLNWYRL